MVELALVGAGVAGLDHARVPLARQGHVVATFDPDVARAQAVASGVGARAAESAEDSVTGVDDMVTEEAKDLPSMESPRLCVRPGPARAGADDAVHGPRPCR